MFDPKTLEPRVLEDLVQNLRGLRNHPPADEDIRWAYGEGADALSAKIKLQLLGYRSRQIELAVQRAQDRGVIQFIGKTLTCMAA